jgi:hypothetical protein
MNWLRLAFILLLPLGLCAGTYEPFDYKSGFSTIQTLGRDIYSLLEPGEKAIISPQPISLDTSRKPFVRLLYLKDGADTVRGVWVSQGFIDLVNLLAHAKAIDKQRKGYFIRYLKLLEAVGDSIPPLPDGTNPSFWTDTMLNEQLSNFNSIMGIVVGINLAQHYLGYYEKHAAKLKDDEEGRVQLNKLLSAEEWQRSYQHGVNNAMLASCMTEGFLPVCEGLNSMKHRPDWANYFFPEKTRFETMRKDLLKLQRKFLND